MGASKVKISTFMEQMTWPSCMGRECSKGKELMGPIPRSCTSMPSQKAYLSFTSFFIRVFL